MAEAKGTGPKQVPKKAAVGVKITGSSLPSARSFQKPRSRQRPSDPAIQASPEELNAIRQLLGTIERLLSVLFGRAYSRDGEGLKSRAMAADLIERRFDAIVEEWAAVVLAVFKGSAEETDETGGAKEVKAALSNALIRFTAHLRDPDDLATYIYLRRHCQTGILSRAAPYQFNLIHIALKQVILNHVHAAFRGRQMEAVRDAVVASVDERRLMVSQFYIESRERALRASEEKHRNGINQARDPIYEIQPATGVVIGANLAAEEFHRAQAPKVYPGQEVKPLVGQPVSDLVPAGIRPATQAHLRRTVDKGSDVMLDLPILESYFDVSSALIPYGDRKFIQMILHDVTTRREIMNELLHSERLAAAGTFAAGVAHEVNNPLASISSLAQSLLAGEDHPGRRATLNTVLSQIARISRTLNDLVNFARPAAAERKAVNLNDLVSETLRLVRYNKRFEGVRIEPVLAPDLAAVLVNSNEIQQVLLNLLFNAADAVQNGAGIIRVVTETHGLSGRASGEEGRAVSIRVSDNGVGIPPNHLDRVFDPFFTTKPVGSGTGLGLSLCQRLIRANGARLESRAKSAEGPRP